MPALRLRSGQAPAGIQGEQAAASSYSAWIPAFAGMTQHSSTPQNHHDRLLVWQGHFKGSAGIGAAELGSDVRASDVKDWRVMPSSAPRIAWSRRRRMCKT